MLKEDSLQLSWELTHSVVLKLRTLDTKVHGVKLQDSSTTTITNMLTRGWGPDRSVEGNDKRNQWKTVDSGEEGGLMLNSDLCLAYDNNSIHQECMEKNNFNNKKCKDKQNKGKPINALEA